MIFKRLSIRAKLQWVILLTTGISLAFTCSIFVLYELTSFTRGEEQELRSLAEMAAESVAAPLAYSHPTEAAGALAKLRDRPEVLVAAVYDVHGRLFAEFRSQNAVRPTPARAPAS